MTDTIRAITPTGERSRRGGDRVNDIFEPDDAEMLASLLADHHAGGRGDGQRWLDVEDGEITGTVMWVGESRGCRRLGLRRQVDV